MTTKQNVTVLVTVAVAFLVSLVTPSWARDPNASGVWRVLPVAGTPPPPRKHHTMVFDPVSNSVILYGGEDANGVLNDVWKLELNQCSRWVQLTPVDDPNHTPGHPEGRHGHSAAFAPNPSRMLIVGGRSDLSSPTSAQSFLTDSWSLSIPSTPGTAPQWTWLSNGPSNAVIQGCPAAQSSPFRQRAHSAAVFFQGGLFIFGGREAPLGAPADGFGMQDTWRLAIGGGWEHRFGSTSPYQIGCLTLARRYWHSLIVDAANNRMVLFGGLYEGEALNTSDVWTSQDGLPGKTDWNGPYPVDVAPSDHFSRHFHTAVYDPIGKRMVVLGGYLPASDPTTLMVDKVTALDLPYPAAAPGTWAELNPAGGPGYIAEHAAIYDSNKDRMIAFGGVTTGRVLRNSDVWMLEFDPVPDTTPPAAVTISAAKGKTTARITWTAPGDDGNSGTACSYDLRRATFAITAANFASATPIITNPPQVNGSPECVRATGLTACTKYWYALRTIDDAGNASALSNVISMTQNCSGPEVTDCGGGGGAAPVASMPTPKLIEYRLASSNPATGETSLFYAIPSEMTGQALEISIFDVAGRRLRTLESVSAVAGEHTATWDHRNSDGGLVSAGVYFARLTIGPETMTQKIVIGLR